MVPNLRQLRRHYLQAARHGRASLKPGEEFSWLQDIKQDRLGTCRSTGGQDGLEAFYLAYGFTRTGRLRNNSNEIVFPPDKRLFRM